MEKNYSLKGKIKSSGILLFLIPSGKYADKLKDIMKACSDMFNRICFVSLNKPYMTLEAEFRKSGIETKKIFFLDCISPESGSAGDDSKVILVSSPKALTELSIAINKVVEKEKIEILVFDSFSTLTAYEDIFTVVKFAHSAILKLRSAGVKGIFPCPREDMESELAKDLSMFVDKIVEMV
jgi:hypothetical protein